MNDKFSKIKNKLIVSNIKDFDFRILCYLISRSKNGKCFPSISTIATDLNKSKETIRNALDRLIELKFITKENRTLGAGKKTSNIYIINEEYLVNKKKLEKFDEITNEELQEKKLELLDYNWLEDEENGLL